MKEVQSAECRVQNGEVAQNLSFSCVSYCYPEKFCFFSNILHGRLCHPLYNSSPPVSVSLVWISVPFGSGPCLFIRVYLCVAACQGSVVRIWLRLRCSVLLS